MKRKLLILVTCAFLSTYGLKAQQDSVLSFSLKEAQDYALEHNTDVKNANLDIESARKKIWETTAIGLPQVNASVDYQYIPGKIPSFNFAGGFIPVLEKLDELHPGEFQEMISSLAQAESPIAVRKSATYGATVSQLVFSGEYIVGLQASKTFLQLSEDSYEKAVLNTKESVALGYFSILTLENSLQIIDSSIVNIQSILTEMTAMNKNGFIEDTDVDQLSLILNNLENSRKSIERQIDVSYYLFKISIGVSIDYKVDLKDNIEVVMANLEIEKLPATAFVLENNIDYKSMETLEMIDKLSLKREKSTYLPTVSAFYNYSDKTEKAAFDFTINHIIGVNVNVPIFSSGMRNAKVQQAKINLEQTRNLKNITKESLNMQSAQTRNAYFSALEKYQTEIKNVELSEKIYSKTLVKYKEGVSSSLDLSQVNTQYLEAQSSLTSSLLELFMAKISLQKLLGTL